MEFIKQMLEKDPKKRVTAREALSHQWITGKPSEQSLGGVQRNLKKFMDE
ncbi:MAG: hypothetical protein KF812_13790 [Fimbriimonadaceae bacterium]|nr:hypothetical protein [Fimbriimonadaceae bacterium]